MKVGKALVFIYKIIMKIGKALFFAKTKEGEHFFRRDVRRRRGGRRQSASFFEKIDPPLCALCVLHTRLPKKKKKSRRE